MGGLRMVVAWSACIGLLSEAAAGEPPPRPPDGREVKIVARGAWPYVPVYAAAAFPRKLQQWVFRDEKELAEAAGPHGPVVVARAFKVDAIDFKKQMVLAVADGTQPLVGVSGGGPPSAPSRIEIGPITAGEDGKVLTVRWRLAPREPADGILSTPLQAVLVERFDGDVRFEREAAPAKDKDTPDKGKAVKVLARASWPDGWRPEEPARQWVVRRYEDLTDPRIEAPDVVVERMRRESADRYARALKVAAVDFGKQMIVGVSGGVQPTGGYTVEITRAEADADGGRMTVHWALRPPAEGAKVTLELTHPAEVALVEQFAGKVRFQEDAPPKKSPGAVKVVTRRSDDVVEVRSETDAAVIDVESPFGISQAVVERVGGEWPKAVTLRLHLKGLSNFRAENGAVTLEASASLEKGKPAVRQWKDGAETPGLDEKSPYWMDVRILGADGKPAEAPPRKEGSFDVTLPKAFFDGNPRSIKVRWIDFYR